MFSAGEWTALRILRERGRVHALDVGKALGAESPLDAGFRAMLGLVDDGFARKVGFARVALTPEGREAFDKVAQLRRRWSITDELHKGAETHVRA